MKIFFYFIASMACATNVNPPTVQQAALIARTLVRQESIADISAFDVKTGTPVEFPEYYVDVLGDGTPSLILVQISLINRNIKATQAKGGRALVSIRVGNHQPWDSFYKTTAKKFPTAHGDSSIYANPRLSLIGEFQDFEPTEQEKAVLIKSFKKRHPDIKMWLPESLKGPHTVKWVKLKIERIHMVGGFKEEAYIGEIPVDLYKHAELI